MNKIPRLLSSIAIFFVMVGLIARVTPVYASITRLDENFGDDGHIIVQDIDWAGGYSSTVINNDLYIAGFVRYSTGWFGRIYKIDKLGHIDEDFFNNSEVNSLEYNTVVSLKKTSDDKLVYTTGTNSTQTSYIFKTNSDGTADDAFNVANNNKALEINNLVNPIIYVGDDDSMILAGRRDPNIVVMKFTRDGLIDTSFGTNGELIFASDFQGLSAIAYQDGYGYVVSGYNSYSNPYNVILARITDDGFLDMSFGENGFVLVAGGTGNLSNLMDDSMIVDSDNKIVILTAQGPYQNKGEVVISRYDRDGNPDTTFGSNNEGYIRYNLVPSIGQAICEYNNRYLVTGTHEENNLQCISLLEFNNDGSVSTRINENGCLGFGTSTYNIGETLTTSEDGHIYVASRSPEGMFVISYENLYQIDNFNQGLNAEVNEFDVTSGTENGVHGTHQVIIKKDGYFLADVGTDFVEDLDWSEVSGDVDVAQRKSFVHNISLAQGATGTFSLYVPRDVDDEGVGICPGAQSIDQVNEECGDLFYLAEDNEDVTIVNIDSVSYWKVDNLSGTGGYSVEDLPQEDLLPDTGGGYVVWLLVCLFATYFVNRRVFLSGGFQM